MSNKVSKEGQWKELLNIDWLLRLTTRARTSLFLLLPPWECSLKGMQQRPFWVEFLKFFLKGFAGTLRHWEVWNVLEMKLLVASDSFLVCCSSDAPGLGRALWSSDFRMGNAVDKQKPLNRSHLYPWKQGKKVQGFISRKKEAGSLLLGYSGSESELQLLGETPSRAENAL